MALFLLAPATLAAGCVTNRASEAPPNQGTPGIELRVSPDRLHTDNWRDVRLTLINHTDREILGVTPGDGSFVGWRTPVVRYQVREEGSGALAVRAPSPGRCGNMNRIGADEVVVIPPGGEAEIDGSWLHDWWGYPPGRYTVVLEYRHDPTIPEHSMFQVPSENDPGAMDQIRRSEPYHCFSAPFTVVIAER